MKRSDDEHMHVVSHCELLFLALMIGACSGPPDSSADADSHPSDAADAGVDMLHDASPLQDDGRGDVLDASADDSGSDYVALMEAYALESCEYGKRCAESEYHWRSIWSDLEFCVQHVVMPVIQQARDEGTAPTQEVLSDCTEALSERECGDPVPAVCEFDERPDGEECRDGTQCASGFCFHEEYEADSCGVCAPRTVEGDACLIQYVDNTPPWFCTDYQLCDEDDTCREPAAPGEACGEGRGCVLWHDCIDGVCVAQGLLGDPCDPFDPALPRCNSIAGFVCHQTLDECVEIASARVGEPCGSIAGGFTGCDGPARCIDGVCVAASAEGGPCTSDLTEGPGCLYYLDCVDGTCRSRQCSRGG